MKFDITAADIYRAIKRGIATTGVNGSTHYFFKATNLQEVDPSSSYAAEGWQQPTSCVQLTSADESLTPMLLSSVSN